MPIDFPLTLILLRKIAYFGAKKSYPWFHFNLRVFFRQSFFYKKREYQFDTIDILSYRCFKSTKSFKNITLNIANFRTAYFRTEGMRLRNQCHLKIYDTYRDTRENVTILNAFSMILYLCANGSRSWRVMIYNLFI